MTKNNSNSNLKLLPFVTALCVLVLTAVSCRNVMLEQKLRNRNKRTVQETIYPDAYYVRAALFGGSDTNNGIAYLTPFATLRKALDMARDSGGKTNRVIVIGTIGKNDIYGGGAQYLKTTEQKIIQSL